MRARTELATFSRSLLDFGALIGLTELAGVNYVLATWVGTIVGALANFAINKVWAFYARGSPMIPTMTRFIAVQAGSSGLHTAGVWLLTRFARLPYPISKLVVAATVYLTWNYPLNRWFVFGRYVNGPPDARRSAPDRSRASAR